MCHWVSDKKRLALWSGVLSNGSFQSDVRCTTTRHERIVLPSNGLTSMQHAVNQNTGGGRWCVCALVRFRAHSVLAISVGK